MDNVQNNIFRQSHLSQRYITYLLLLSFFYLSYRYPFQINSTTTSPTYANTPLVLALGKYIILVAILLLFFIKSSFINKLAKYSYREFIEFIIIVCLFLLPFISAIVSGQSVLFETGIFFIIILPMLFFRYGQFSIEKINKLINVFLFFAIASNIIQLLMFFIWGRLPALAYNNSLSVRFGSIWDDPNGFSIFLSFLFGYIIYSNIKSIKKFMLVFTLIIMLILTQSLTGYISNIIGALTVSWLIIFSNNSLKTMKVLIPVSIIIIISVIYILNSELFQLFMETKYESIELHLDIFEKIKEVNIISYLGINPVGFYGESGYINILLNFGIIYFFMYLFFGIVIIWRSLKIIRICVDQNKIKLFYGILYFIVAYYIGLSNLPLDTVFPLNLLVPIFYIITYSTYNQLKCSSYSKKIEN